MKMFHDIEDLHSSLQINRQQGQRIGLVPTMGNLHQGHLKLVEVAQTLCDIVIVSIFVNPMQFGPNEDFDDYPRTLEQDRKLLTQLNTDYLFVPKTQSIYPNGLKNQTTVHVYGVSEGLCGAGRPGHFDGVATVISKLFNLAQPDCAFFGEKDYQQVALIQQMTRDLCFPVEVVSVPTVREKDGLALSSRNQYLSPEERNLAPLFYATLQHVKGSISTNPKTHAQTLEQAIKYLSAQGLTPEYLEIRRASDLKMPLPEDTELVILGAVKMGKTRLIDNLRITLNTKRV